ncbi:MAG TPA: quinone-dependent dihydroorotate dehydrogenase [Caulobacteraceae bacterium]|jgi:dihydroorotate dehydrogenase|nr:quinone-dependent dihydroorotate dehydrogenase [Caulobacteraceae bacterium]
MSAVHAAAAWALGRIDPEAAHRLTLRGLAAGLGPVDATPDDPILATTLAGLTLSNPIGVAAGFDKDAAAPAALARMGFGVVECGTVTPLPQEGNPRPRLFRLRADGAVINRMGFNNAGLEAFAGNLGRLPAPRSTPVGANVGANKTSDDRAGDYVAGLERLWTLADYFTLNVSSPNTPGLRDLQEGSALEALLSRASEARRRLAAVSADHPVLLKIAPDMSPEQAQAVVEAALRHGLDGLIVSNTTTARPAGLGGRYAGEAGGLSGAPLFEASTRLLGAVREAAGGRLALVGAGGVGSGAQAYAKIRAGASVVQLYTALALRGPGLIGQIKRDLAARLRADGFSSVAQAAAAR